MNGWVKSWRKNLEWGWFTDVPVAHFWEYVRLKANPRENQWHGEVIPKGSFVSSVDHMSVECGLSPKQIRLAISKLEKTGEITVIRTNRYTMINVVKWADYQGCDDDEGKPEDKPKGEPEGKPTSRERATNEEEKKRRRKNITPYNPPSLDDVVAYCRSRNSSVNPKQFYDYFTTGNWKDSKGNPVINWKQKLITWERHDPKPQAVEDDTVPVYDDSNNVSISDDELKEILKEMRK